MVPNITAYIQVPVGRLSDTRTNQHSNSHHMKSQQHCSITNLNIYLKLSRTKQYGAHYWQKF